MIMSEKVCTSPLTRCRDQNLSYFEVNRTPPEEKKRLEKAAKLAASQEVSVLLLTPFTAIPRISFDKIKLGSSAVRQLVVRNPGDKSLAVSLEKLPSEEKGFAVDYVSFRLGGREETTLLVGWTPQKGGGLRDNIIVKFGSFRSQIILNGSCIAPEEKKVVRVPPRSVRPLGPKNSQKPVKTRPTFPASKLNAAPKVTIPPNPVVRMNASPPKRVFETTGIGKSHEIPDNNDQNGTPSRRETFVRERPAPAINDVLESTPINPEKKFPRPENPIEKMGPPCRIPSDRRQTYMPSRDRVPESNKENYEAPSRRETFQPTDLDRRFNHPQRRDTYVKPPPASSESWTPQKLVTGLGTERRKWQEAPVNPANFSGLQQLDETEESIFDYAEESTVNCSVDVNKYLLSPAKNIVSESAIQEVLDEVAAGNCSVPRIVLSHPEDEPLNLSVPLNLSIKKNTASVYQPEVSDISLDEYSLNISENEAGMSMAVNMSEIGLDRVEGLDDDLADLEDRQLDEEIDQLAAARAASGCRDELTPDADVYGDNRLSSGTMVRNAPSLHASYLPDITDLHISLETPELHISETHVQYQEDRFITETELVREEVVEEVIEYEYEVIGDQRRLVAENNIGKTVTVKEHERVISTPRKETRTVEYTSMTRTQGNQGELQDHGDTLPTLAVNRCTEMNADNEVDLAIKEQLQSDDIEQTNIQEQIDAEVIRAQLELELLVAEQLQPVVCKEVADPSDTPILVEDKLCTVSPKKVPRGMNLTESELNGMLGMLALSEPHSDQPLTSPVTEVRSRPRLETRSPEPYQSRALADNLTPEATKPNRVNQIYADLPGLKGSPRFSNQNYPSNQSFLCKTVNETSFMPPSPDDPRRCSTGVKTKGNEQKFEISSEIKKSLFTEDNENLEEFDPVPLSSGGHQLPVILDIQPKSPNSRLSSDTYIAAQEPLPLSIIQEADELSQVTKNKTFEKDEEEKVSPLKLAPAIQEEAVQAQPEQVHPAPPEEKTTLLKARTPTRARRSNIQYISKPIGNIATEKAETTTPAESTGLMFVSLSPGNREKRKSETATRSCKVDYKKSRLTASTVVTKPAARVVAHKNPIQPKPMNAAKARMSLQKPLKPAASSSRRSLQPTKRLSLNRPAKSTTTISHPNPFASRNRYYDERWVEKQEKGFSNWLNFILTPQGLDDGSSAGTAGTVDVAKLWSQCSQDVKVPRAPTREVMSMRAYTAKREMNRLRRASCRLWQSRSVAMVVGKLEVEIEKLRLVVRKDKNINKDVGMKQAILSLILSYNPLWLRVGIETIYGELLHVGSNRDLVGLSRFIVTRLLSSPDILAEFAHPTVPHSYREGHQDALNKFTLKKFLELVYFLDCAKESRLIQHNPCLFCPDSKIKSSRDVLTMFSRDYLSGEGDIVKHLAYLGYDVKHKQTALDEFDFAVTNISTDLRCGLRLTKVAELLTGAVVSGQLRIPAVSRLQKVHNTEVALKQLKRTNSCVPTNITSKDLVEGHREKTLSLLWSIIFGFQMTAILDGEKLRLEILHLRRSLRVRVRLGDENARKGMKFLTELKSRSPNPSSDSDVEGEGIGLLKEWAQLVGAHYNVEVENWTVSWCDGRGLCFLVHHYQPALLGLKDIKQDTTLTSLSCSAALDDSLEFSYGNQGLDRDQYNSLLDNEMKNFKLLLNKVQELGGVPILINPGDMSNTIPDEKVTLTFIGYLAARLLDISREIKAARLIQLAWRKHFAARREEKMKVKYQTTL